MSCRWIYACLSVFLSICINLGRYCAWTSITPVPSYNFSIHIFMYRYRYIGLYTCIIYNNTRNIFHTIHYYFIYIIIVTYIIWIWCVCIQELKDLYSDETTLSRVSDGWVVTFGIECLLAQIPSKHSAGLRNLISLWGFLW